MNQLLKPLNPRDLFVWLFVLAAFASCKEDEPTPAAPKTENQKINAWILEEMDFWYLWNTSLPADPNDELTPPTFFESLLHSEDRFSWIQDDYDELLKSLQGINKEAGFEFVLYKESQTTDNVIAQITYVKQGSPASETVLKRGDIITHINGTQITVNNYQSLIGDLSENHTITFEPLVDVEAGSLEDAFGAPENLSLIPVEYSENPNFMSKVIVQGDRKIGYYVYNFFATGTTTSPDDYAAEMDEIFGMFKAEGITDLVLDLRYNGGGSESAAIDLASYIGVGADGSKVFARKEYNDLVEDAILSDPQLGEDFLISRFDPKANNIGGQLTGSRVYILTSGRTASASELVINALKPYMDVFLIGNVTYGKNVGSISIQEEDNPANHWGMQPIVVKIYNSLDQSDYTNGFTPNVFNEDKSVYLYPLGDLNETMLAQAIGQITGSATTGRVAPREGKTLLGHSLDFKRRGFELVIDENVPMIHP